MPIEQYQQSNPIIVALDGLAVFEMLTIVHETAPFVHGFKFNSALFNEDIDDVVSAAKDLGSAIFIDAKLHDIPNTVFNQVEELCRRFDPDYITVHASGGSAMVQRAKDASRANSDANREEHAKIIAVTVLTSIDKEAADVFFKHDIGTTVNNLAYLVEDADGYVCSAHEVAALRDRHPDAILMVPGIRPEWHSAVDDQKRVATPQVALKNGASRLVMGRAIVKADRPRQAAYRTAVECGYHPMIAYAKIAGALQYGEFTLKSGRVSPYFFNLGKVFEYRDQDLHKAVCELYTQHSFENFPEATCVVGPAYKAIPLVMNHAGSSPLRPCVLRSEVKDHGEGGQFVFGTPKEGDKVVIFDDVITDGATKRAAVEAVRATGAEVIGVVVAFDRGEKLHGQTRSAIDAFTEDTGVPVVAIASVADLLLDAPVEYRTKINEYLAKYGATT